MAVLDGETSASDVASPACKNTVTNEKNTAEGEAKKANVPEYGNSVKLPQKGDFNYADHEKCTDHEHSTRPDALDTVDDKKSTLAIPMISHVKENSDLHTESLSIHGEDSSAGFDTSTKIDRKRKISKTFSDIRSMFEKKAKRCTDDQALYAAGRNVENELHQNTQKRRRAKSSPANAEELFTDGAASYSVNGPPSTTKNLMDRLNKLIEAMKSGQQATSHNHPEVISSYDTETFYNTLKYFQERAMAGNSATEKKRSLPLKDQSKIFTVDSGANLLNDSLMTEHVPTQSDMDSGQIFRSVDEFMKLIDAIAPGHSLELNSFNGLPADCQMIANYLKSKEFYDTLMLFEEKARASNHSTASTMKTFSTKNIRNQRRSLPMDQTYEADEVTPTNEDVTESQHVKPRYLTSRRRSTPKEFAPIDREECMKLKDYDACSKYNKTYSTDSTLLQALGLTPTKPISNQKIDLHVLEAHRHGKSLSADDTSFSSVQLACSEAEQGLKDSFSASDFSESLNAAFKTTCAAGHPSNCKNSRILFKAALFVAEKQHIDINLVPSAMVNNLDTLASFLCLRMPSHRIPFNSLGRVIMDFTSSYRYKPLARVMLEDLTPDEEERLIQDLQEAVRYFPNQDLTDLAQGEITSGPLYLAVSRVVNNFVSQINSNRRILALRQGVWNSCI